MKNKKDPKLGKAVSEKLTALGVETPAVMRMAGNAETCISANFKQIMEALGMNLLDDSLSDTPNRVAKMYVDEIFSGLDYDNFPKCTTTENKMRYDEMITMKDVKSISVCEHHFVTIDGKAKVSYIPKDKIIGLSKINRIVKFFSQRPQIQERLTVQIYHALSLILDTEDVAVMIEADHMCVKQRGVEDYSSTVTTKLGGVYKESDVKSEFLKC